MSLAMGMTHLQCRHHLRSSFTFVNMFIVEATLTTLKREFCQFRFFVKGITCDAVTCVTGVKWNNVQTGLIFCL